MRKIPFGYTLPHSPSGKLSLVSKPPWYFGGDLYEIIYRTDPVNHLAFLPSPLKQIPNKPWVSIAFVDMISTSSIDDVVFQPERTQYKECLIKLLCDFNGIPMWYVPISWVTTDFSIMRGFLLGFGKMLGSINISKYHPLNPLTKNIDSPREFTATCSTENGTQICLHLKLVKKIKKIPHGNINLCTQRFFPNIKDMNKPIVHDLSTLDVTDYTRKDIWDAQGEILITSKNDDLLALNAIEIINAHIFREGFALQGLKNIFNFLNE